MFKFLNQKTSSCLLCRQKLVRLQSTVAPQLRTTNTLKKAQFNLKYFYENADAFKDICTKRNTKYTLGEDFKELYDELAKVKQEVIDIKKDSKQYQNTLKKLVIQQKKEEADTQEQQKELHQKLSEFKPLLKEKEESVIKLEDELNLRADGLPNLIAPVVGNKQKLVTYINPTPEILDFKDDDFPLSPDAKRDHKDIMERLNLVEFQQATKLSGRGWYYLLGDAALLEQALVQYALKLARKAGFKMALPPSIVKTEVTNACGFKPRDQNNEKQVYELTGDGLCLTGTAEIPLAGLYSNKEFKAGELPLELVGLSRSYRAEAGAAGRDTRGLYRVHEFTKVELFAWTINDVEHSNAQFDKMINFQMNFIKSLGLTARMLIMPFDDLGAPAYKKIDIEVLMPGRGAWGEVSSTSNCLDYQARRLTTKYKDEKTKKNKYVHTLNGTACAVPRVVLAIIERFYDPATDSIIIPEVLRPFMDDKERITKN
ncbi:unnamed protein product [Ambrosiozyma monospora]|uniref:Unnamed protein product n=1 Tax=Ambrosiozyma monospora TaxID=43982 RepID=A0ACB5SYL9_AMBMO|nr:unnamed protein product [Ambrosiozyma monospora]